MATCAAYRTDIIHNDEQDNSLIVFYELDCHGILLLEHKKMCSPILLWYKAGIDNHWEEKNKA
jgi:hypothetical protein